MRLRSRLLPTPANSRFFCLLPRLGSSKIPRSTRFFENSRTTRATCGGWKEHGEIRFSDERPREPALAHLAYFPPTRPPTSHSSSPFLRLYHPPLPSPLVPETDSTAWNALIFPTPWIPKTIPISIRSPRATAAPSVYSRIFRPPNFLINLFSPSPFLRCKNRLSRMY